MILEIKVVPSLEIERGAPPLKIPLEIQEVSTTDAPVAIVAKMRTDEETIYRSYGGRLWVELIGGEHLTGLGNLPQYIIDGLIGITPPETRDQRFARMKVSLVLLFGFYCANRDGARRAAENLARDLIVVNGRMCKAASEPAYIGTVKIGKVILEDARAPEHIPTMSEELQYFGLLEYDEAMRWVQHTAQKRHIEVKSALSTYEIIRPEAIKFSGIPIRTTILKNNIEQKSRIRKSIEEEIKNLKKELSRLEQTA